MDGWMEIERRARERGENRRERSVDGWDDK